MDVDGPDAAEGDEAADRFQGEAEDEGGEVDKAHGVDRVERMLAVGGQPVEVFGAMVDSVEAPQETDAVLEAVPPIDKEVAQDDDFERLMPPRLRSDGPAEAIRNDAVEPVAELCE